MDPYIGEIRVFGFTYPPRGWAQCDGQLLAISQFTALFSILGTRYGGDGKTNFALPDLRAIAALGQGQGRGLSPYEVGETGGVSTVTLTEAETPTHNHLAQATPEVGDLQAPGPDRPLARSTPGNAYQGNSTENLVRMNPQSTTFAGSGQPHNNVSPSLVMRACIALDGIFPPRE